MPELLLALDVGTTSARALVVDGEGRVRGGAHRPISTVYPAPGRAEQDAEAVWRLALAVIREALTAAAVEVGEVAALGVTTQRASLVAWRRSDGAPLAPMILWNDLSGAEKVRDLQDAGFPAWPQAPACKLEGLLRRCVGDPAERLWGGLDSYLVFRLSGGAAHVTDLSAAWFSGWLDPGQGVWRRPLLDHLNIDEARLPRLVDSWGEIAVTAPDVLGCAVPITALTGDQQAGMFAHGGLEAGIWKASLGTSAVVMASTGSAPIRPHPSMPPEAMVRQGGRTIWGVEGMVITAGAAVEWMCGPLGLFDDAAALCATAGVSSSAGLALRPSLLGLGAPHMRFGEGGLIAGLHPGVGRAELARALLEGIAFRLGEICEAMAQGLPVSETLSVDGGLSESPLLLQLIADAVGRPVRRLASREGSGVGVALAAALGAGRLTEADLPSRARYDLVVEPRLSREEGRAAYDAWAAAVMPPS